MLKELHIHVIKRAKALTGFSHPVKISFDEKLRSTRRLGYYVYGTNRIILVPKNHPTFAEYVDTILHEFAHLLVYYTHGSNANGHGSEWKQIAAKIGAKSTAYLTVTARKGAKRAVYLAATDVKEREYPAYLGDLTKYENYFNETYLNKKVLEC